MKLHAVACIAAASLISVAPAQDPAAAAPAGAPPVPAHADNAPPAPGHDNGETLWPQEAALDGDAYVLYSPQFESIDGSKAKARVAFRRTPKGAQPVYGSARFTAALDNTTSRRAWWWSRTSSSRRPR